MLNILPTSQFCDYLRESISLLGVLSLLSLCYGSTRSLQLNLLAHQYLETAAQGLSSSQDRICNMICKLPSFSFDWLDRSLISPLNLFISSFKMITNTPLFTMVIKKSRKNFHWLLENSIEWFVELISRTIVLEEF